MRSWLGLVAVVVCGCVPAAALGFAGRGFELVSPVYKGGFGAAHIEAVAQNGESVVFFSPGAFAGEPGGFSEGLDNSYFAHRGVSGWSTVPLAPPVTLAPLVTVRDELPALDRTLVLAKPGPEEEFAIQLGTQQEFLLHPTGSPDVQANWELAGAPLELLSKEPILFGYKGASPDFCHLFVTAQFAAGRAKDTALLPKAEGTASQVYELVRGCGGEPVELRLVALDSEGNVISPQCPVYVGESANKFNSVAAGGGEVFFMTCIEDLPTDQQLFVRLGGARTLEVSKPLGGCAKMPCPGAGERAPASFVGASEDGSKVFFMTTAPLTGTGDSSMNLYMADIGCPVSEPECTVADRIVSSLVQVSRDPGGGQAAVQGVVRVAPDGSRVYFVASGDLLGAAERQVLVGEGRGVPGVGADNLYVYNAVSGQLSFIGDLCAGHGVSGSIEDSRCPGSGSDRSLWSNIGADAQTAGVDGRFLVFSTYAQLVANDTDGAADVYRYDAETGMLDRVSIGEGGAHGNGNDSQFDATITPGHYGGLVRDQYELNSRAVSEDGSRIVFTTAEPLSAAATNHLTNVYEWHQQPGASGGEVSLISSGSAPTADGDPVITPEGRDVFLITTQGLVAQDTDGAPDVYDARLHGGFPSPVALREECSGDACQGPLSNPVPLLVPGSVEQVSGEDFPPASKVALAPKTKKKLRASRRSRKHKTRSKIRARHASRAPRGTVVRRL